MAERDPVREIRELIDQATHGTPYTARVIAAQIVDRLRTTDPELLHAYLDAMAVDAIWNAIDRRDRSARAHARRTSAAAAFGRDARSGDNRLVARWLEVPFQTSTGDRKRLKDLTHEDLLWARDNYQAAANNMQFTAVFLNVLSRTVQPGTTVGDHYSDTQLTKLWQDATRSDDD